jgi:hypothetical protein
MWPQRYPSSWACTALSCKELREAKTVEVRHRADRLSEDDLATFGTLGSLLPALDMLILNIYPRA